MITSIPLAILTSVAGLQTDNIGPQDADLQIQLKPRHHPSLQYAQRIRDAVGQRMPGVEIYSQAADITSQVLNFGLSAPIDVQIPQVFDYPTLMVNVDRNQAIRFGMSESAAARSLLDSLASRAVVAPNNWLDWNLGVQYNVGVQTPQHVCLLFPSC